MPANPAVRSPAAKEAVPRVERCERVCLRLALAAKSGPPRRGLVHAPRGDGPCSGIVLLALLCPTGRRCACMSHQPTLHSICLEGPLYRSTC